jgi:hypothetical protein
MAVAAQHRRKGCRTNAGGKADHPFTVRRGLPPFFVQPFAGIFVAHIPFGKIVGHAVHFADKA